MPRSPHRALLLTPLVLALALAVLLPPTAASAVTSAPPTASSRAAGSIAGWADAPSSVRAGSTYAARVRVSGGSRTVALQRRTGTTWRTVAKTSSSSTGLALLRWVAPRTATRVVLRVLAPRSGSRPTLVSAARTITVRAAVVDTLTATLSSVLGLVNQARSTGYTCGGVRYPAVPALRVETRLSRAADKFARLMADRDFFSHDSPDGSGPGDRITAEGYRWRAYGENIAAGQPSAAEVVAAWLASPGHCTNLMNGTFTEIGLGHAYTSSSTYGHYWVQDFARPM